MCDMYRRKCRAPLNRELATAEQNAASEITGGNVYISVCVCHLIRRYLFPSSHANVSESFFIRYICVEGVFFSK